MKKNKNAIVKRQAKSKEKAKKKRQIHLEKSMPKFMERPPISHMEAPEGFMAVSMSQALMHYAKPLMDENAESLDELNRRMELASSLWNLAVSRQKNEQQEYSRWLKKTKASAKTVLNLKGEDCDRYIEEMIERQIHLFPQEVQPEPPSMFMHMRKEINYLIPPFNYGRIRFRDDTPIGPDEEDLRLIGKIKALDDHIRRESEYDAFEELALAVEDESQSSFQKWLIAKGFEDDPEQYVHCPELFLIFLYRYQHDDLVLLKSVPDQYFIEFFEDFLLRKVVCKPAEYLYWLPSLKLFNRFLYEKGYLSRQEMSVLLDSLEAMEPNFLKTLRQRYQ